MNASTIPDGFKDVGKGPYSQHIGPILYKRETVEGTLMGWVGIQLTELHIGGNNRGHGGLLLTLLDEAMGMNAAFARGSMPVVTVSMQTHFLAATLPGQFLMATGTVTHATRSLAFMEGKAWCGDTLVGSGTGVWKYFDPSRKAS